ncbi:MAG: hypothetical protein KC414_00155 [Romboutsia sp.]|nr:hypothetical protein [Romboutsia sp.]
MPMRGNVCTTYNNQNVPGLQNRFNLILATIKECKLLKILHIGCCDAIAQTDSSCIKRKILHDYLYDQYPNIDGLQLDGLDINADAIKNMRKIYPKSNFFTSVDEINEDYDLIIIPEVMEHVDNIKNFVEEIKKIHTKKTIITVPSINNIETYKSTIVIQDNTYKESVHSDHNVWFSPYTLSNIIRKYWGIRVDKVYLLGKLSLGVVF